jgi:hypothetical protein
MLVEIEQQQTEQLRQYKKSTSPTTDEKSVPFEERTHQVDQLDPHGNEHQKVESAHHVLCELQSPSLEKVSARRIEHRNLDCTAVARNCDMVPKLPPARWRVRQHLSIDGGCPACDGAALLLRGDVRKPIALAGWQGCAVGPEYYRAPAPALVRFHSHADVHDQWHHSFRSTPSTRGLALGK